MPNLQAAQRGELDGTEIRCIVELVAQLDRHIRVPERDLDGAFLMPIEGVHSIVGRGTVVTGRVERGRLRVGDSVEIAGRNESGRNVVVTGIQAFHKDVPEAKAGLNVGLLLRGVECRDVVRGQVLIAPASLGTHESARAEIFVLTAKEGGRHTAFNSGYMPQLFFGASDVTATVETEGDRPVSPGDRATVQLALHRATAFEPGMRFAIREGGKTVGAGVVIATG